MNRNKYFLILFFITFQNILLKAQFDNLSFERIDADQGLPNCNIEEAIEDHFGFLWFATCEGLFRYDGYEFKAFRHDVKDSTSLSDPYVHSLFEDSEENLWVGTASGLNLLDRRTGKFQRFKPDPEDTKAKLTDHVWKIFEDSQGNLLLSANRSLLRFDRKHQKFISLTQKGERENNHFVKNIFEDRNNVIWVGTSNGILKLNAGDTTFQFILPDPNTQSRYNKYIEGFVEFDENTLLMGTRGGLIRWNPQTNEIQKSFLPAALRNLPIANILKDSHGNIWISFINHGLGIYDIKKQKFNYYTYNPNQLNGLNNNNVICTLEDRFRNIWVCTSGGACKIKTDDTGFYLLQNTNGFDDNANDIIRVFQDRKGNIWSKTPKGLFKIENDKSYGEKVKVPQVPDDYSVSTAFLEAPKGSIWISIEDHGMYHQAPDASFFTKVQLGDTLENAYIYKIVLDHSDKSIAWIGTSEGLCKFNLITHRRNWYIPTDDIPDAASNKVSIFEQYGSDEIWLYYTYYGSLGRFDKKTGKFEEYRPGPEKQKVLKGFILDIALSDDGNIWLATLYGLTNFNIKTKQYEIYNKTDGLAESELNTILIDQKGQIWICGYRFLSRFDPTEKTFSNYLISNELKRFSSKSKYLADDGKILFGSTNGIYFFYPEAITKNQEVPNVVLTNFIVKDESYMLEKPFENVSEIILSHDENDITFEFSGLHYINPKANQYRCKLEGYNKKWQDLGHEHRAVYANLDPGDYTFKVLAANSDGVWNENGLSIDLLITPAFWQTIWFKALIILIIISIAYALFKNRQHQLSLLRQKQLAEQSAEYKTKFLADVSHEIRTPMNAIIGLSKLTLDTELDKKQNKFISAIQQSSQNLLTIINDLLDHTKLEAGKFSFVKKPFELTTLIDHLKNTLTHKAEEKQLNFELNIDPNIPEKLIGDPIRLNQILTNLLGNSLKFTESGKVWLNVEIKQESDQKIHLNFEVGDTGIGIPKNKIHSIFESFNQADNGINKGMEGTGLGLSIAQQMVEKQGGQLFIESELSKGTKLWFDLTFEKTKLKKNIKEQENINLSAAQLNILVVEDTYFNQMLVIEILKKHFKNTNITVAENGKIALEKITQSPFDLILMDVKMPVMDGYKATKRIRDLDDPLLSTIPILGVTASAIPDQLQKCKDAGMNNFITKPINENELIKKIHLLTQPQES